MGEEPAFILHLAWPYRHRIHWHRAGTCRQPPGPAPGAAGPQRIPARRRHHCHRRYNLWLRNLYRSAQRGGELHHHRTQKQFFEHRPQRHACLRCDLCAQRPHHSDLGCPSDGRIQRENHRVVPLYAVDSLSTLDMIGGERRTLKNKKLREFKIRSSAFNKPPPDLPQIRRSDRQIHSQLFYRRIWGRSLSIFGSRYAPWWGSNLGCAGDG
jgi:hypothetical protein